MEHGQREPERHCVDLGAQGRRLGFDLRNARRQRRHPHHHEKRLGRESPDQLLLQRHPANALQRPALRFGLRPAPGAYQRVVRQHRDLAHLLPIEHRPLAGEVG